MFAVFYRQHPLKKPIRVDVCVPLSAAQATLVYVNLQVASKYVNAKNIK